jgi:hypothetical protein
LTTDRESNPETQRTQGENAASNQYEEAAGQRDLPLFRSLVFLELA